MGLGAAIRGFLIFPVATFAGSGEPRWGGLAAWYGTSATPPQGVVSRMPRLKSRLRL